MKVLLIYPPCLEDRLREEDIRAVPLGLYYVGAALKADGHDVDVLNWYNLRNAPEKIRESLISRDPDVIGFSILHANRWGGIDIARVAREVNPEIRIVFGGVGATFLWEHLLTHFREIDFVVIGEGEDTFPNLIRALETGNTAGVGKIRGLAFRTAAGVTRTPDAPLISDLDRLPDPARYFEFQHVSSTRGCPGNCAFCGSPRFWKRRVRYHSPGYFVRQLERLHDRGIRFFYFSDDTFTLREKRVIEICRKIIERRLDISWAAISRVDTVTGDMLRWMRRAGCIQISYGVESGSEKIRNGLLKKNISDRQIRRAFALTTGYGILARAYFIYGNPGETADTIRASIELIHEIRPLSAIFYILDLFPGTALYSDFMKRAGVTDDIWLKRVEDIMYFETDPDLSAKKVLAFGEQLRTSFYRELPAFAKDLQLVDETALYRAHSDFLSRLGMTFTHGDYAAREEIPGKEKTAETLYRRALAYHPDHRAYLGLGLIRQKKGDFEASNRVLLEGVSHFPESEPLNMCLGINYLNLRDPGRALPFFLKFRRSKEAGPYIAACYEALGDKQRASGYRRDERP